jgi:hypothetical protein
MPRWVRILYWSRSSIGTPAGGCGFEVPGGDLTAELGATDRGGSIEMFATAADAQARSSYLDEISKSASMFAEYHYLHDRAIVRVSKNVKPSVAAKVEAAVKALRP